MYPLKSVIPALYALPSVVKPVLSITPYSFISRAMANCTVRSCFRAFQSSTLYSRVRSTPTIPPTPTRFRPKISKTTMLRVKHALILGYHPAFDLKSDAGWYSAHSGKSIRMSPGSIAAPRNTGARPTGSVCAFTQIAVCLARLHRTALTQQSGGSVSKSRLLGPSRQRGA